MCIKLLTFLVSRVTWTGCILARRIFSRTMDTFRWAFNTALCPVWLFSEALFGFLLKFNRKHPAVKELITEEMVRQSEEGLVRGNESAIDSAIHLRTIQEQNRHFEEELRKKDVLIAELEQSLQDSAERENEAVKRAQKLEDALKKCEAEKEEALTRLSRIVSVQVRDSNPTIVDLSDANRPEKLAELSNEIYDNQWSDAFDELEENIDDEDTRIQLLLDVLMICYTFCISKGKTQLEFVNKWFIPNSDDQSNLATQKQLKDARKQKAMECLPIVETECNLKLKQDVKLFENLDIDALPYLQAYISECIKLCWLMSIQDPPCVMLCQGWPGTTSLSEDNPDHDTWKLGRSQAASASTGGSVDQVPESNGAVHNGDTVRLSITDDSLNEASSNGGRVILDKQLYKTYTQNGKYIQFMVWPCMLLHEGGQTLTKGVAQGCD